MDSYAVETVSKSRCSMFEGWNETGYSLVADRGSSGLSMQDTGPREKCGDSCRWNGVPSSLQ